MSLLTEPVTSPSAASDRSERAGGVAALVAAATFIVGIALYATMLSDYTSDISPAAAVEFVVDHQGALYLWYFVIFLVFGVALVPLVRALHHRLRGAQPALADAGAVFGYVWVGLMFASGMVSNLSIEAVADAAERDVEQAATMWSTLDAVTNGLGGGNELVGGLWILLTSIAGLRTGLLPRAAGAIGVVAATAGLVTLVPGLGEVGMLFGLGSIVWFLWVGVALLRPTRR